MTRSLLLVASFALVALGLLTKPVVGQTLTVTENKDAAALAAQILNPSASGVTIVSTQLVGHPGQFANYSQSHLFQNLANTGALLSTGWAVEVDADIGVGNGDGDFDHAGDGDLDQVLTWMQPETPYETADAAVLLMEVKVPRPVAITLSYVFGSSNYPNHEGGETVFPDIFGIFVNGVYTSLIGGNPVSVATVYCNNNGFGGGGSNCDEYVNNNAQRGTSLKGYTKTQTVMLNLPAGTHQVKVAVADSGIAGMNVYGDSAVLLNFQGAAFAPIAPARKRMKQSFQEELSALE
jgi:hypothetical protein